MDDSEILEVLQFCMKEMDKNHFLKQAVHASLLLKRERLDDPDAIVWWFMSAVYISWLTSDRDREAPVVREVIDLFVEREERMPPIAQKVMDFVVCAHMEQEVFGR